MPHVQKFFEKYSDKDVVVLTINYSPAEKEFVLETMKARRYTFPVLQVPDGSWSSSFGRALGTDGLNFIFDRNGRLVFTTSPSNKEAVETMENEFEMLLASPAQKQEVAEKEKQ